MRILVTGGAGYIGSATVEALVGSGDDVFVADDLRKGHVKAVAPGIRIHQIDLADRSAVHELFVHEPVDAVVHFAADSLVGESVGQPAKYYLNNVISTLNVLDAMVRFDVRRFVFSSTAAVYGQPGQVPISEDSPHWPTNPYGETKLAIERALPWYDSAYGLRFASLRYFNAAGATERCGEDHEPESHLIPLLIDVALGKRPQAEIYGTDYDTPDGTCIRDYIHVADLAQAHVLALHALGSESRFFNLGNGEGFSVRQVLDTTRKVTGHPIPALEMPRRPGDPPRLVASSQRIRRELGWKPRWPGIAEIIESSWKWAQLHPNGYDDRRS